MVIHSSLYRSNQKIGCLLYLLANTVSSSWGGVGGHKTSQKSIPPEKWPEECLKWARGG